MVENLTRNWGWIALRGVVAVLFGLVAIFNPGITLRMLVLLFGAFAMSDGILMVVSAVANRHGQPRWVALLVGGILAIGVGLVTFAVPGITTMVLLTLIAAWAIAAGVAEIVAAMRLRKVIEGEWLFTLSGVLALIFGVIMLTGPRVGALAMVLWIGGYAILSGIMQVVLGFRLRSWNRLHARLAGPAT